jgi:xanthosine utilization system XapX-like protein
MLELAPAPPTVALVGLLGMLGGEHMTPLVRTWLAPGIH